MTTDDLNRMKAASVSDKYYSEILALAEKSPDELFKRYFNKYASPDFVQMRQDFPMKQFGSVMKVLYQKNYLILLVEGQFYIEDLNFCKLHSN